MAGVRLADLVETADRVAATRSRTAKVAAMADLFRQAGPAQAAVVAGLLSGAPRQGRIGVGWATVFGLHVEPAAAPSLTVDDLDAVLDEVAATSGEGSAGLRTALLVDLLGRATPAEADFLRRLLVGELRHGALAALVGEAVAAAAGVGVAEVRRAAMLRGDLAAVATIALAQGSSGLAAVGLEVLRPVLPMLASPATDLADALGATGTASVEWKLDGARVQVHRAGGEVRVFTRSLHDVTTRLAGVAALARSLPARRFVLDGEVLGLADDERPERFQDSMSRFGAHADGVGSTLAVRFFDLLHLDGTDLIDEPLAVRQAALDAVAAEWRVPAVVTADVDEAAAWLDRALAAGHEGVVVKAISSRYEAGRRGGAWRKVKPVRTLDLVVLAAEWGHGRRRGWLSNIHLGARGPDGGFVMVGKTFKGMTDQVLAWQTEAFQERAVGRPAWGVEVRPDLVVEVAVDGVQRSTRYAGGVALRFARVRRYRPDKSPDDADTIDAVRALLPGP
jgi:DNA ligase-1